VDICGVEGKDYFCPKIYWMYMKQNRLPIGTFINMATVVVGSTVGILFKSAIGADYQSIVFQALGLGTLMIGLKMTLAVKGDHILKIIFALVIGGVVGNFLQLDVQMASLSESVKTLIGSEEKGFTDGLVNAFLLFCIGSMTILGSLEEGLSGKKELLMVKSTLDGFASIALAAVYGVGVLFSILPMLIFQGGITIFAPFIKSLVSEDHLDAIGALGGVLILGIAIRMLELGQINLENLLPALILIIPILSISEKFGKSMAKIS